MCIQEQIGYQVFKASINIELASFGYGVHHNELEVVNILSLVVKGLNFQDKVFDPMVFN